MYRTCCPSSPRSRWSTITATGCSGPAAIWPGLLNEADGEAAADGMPFDSLAGLALRRWCPPLLGLPPHASVDSYVERRAALGLEEVSRRFLGASGLAALCVDTGYTPAGLLSPGETASLAGAAAFEVVRLEQVAESLAPVGSARRRLPRRVPDGA